MELWPENEPITRLKHSGYAIGFILFLATILLGEYLNSFPLLLPLPITASLNSFAYFFACLLVLLGLGIKCLSADNELRKIQYGFAFWGFFIFAWMLWIGQGLINIKADSSKPKQMQVLVVGKRHSTGKGGGSDHLDVELINAKKERYSFRVSSSVYFKTNVNDILSLSIKQGYLNKPWVMSQENLSQSL